MREQADHAFDKGDYQSARPLYQALLNDAQASSDDQHHARQRLQALAPDKLEILLGLGTLSFIVVAYILARLA